MISKFGAIKAISFDLDDTLYDNRPVIMNAFKILYDHLCEQHPQLKHCYNFTTFLDSASEIRTAHPHEFDLKRLRKLHIQAILTKVSIELSIDDSFIEMAFEQFWQARQNVCLFDETIAVLEKLSSQYPLVSISNGNVDPRAIGIDEYFSFHINASSSGKPKPDVEMFNLACSKLKIKSSELLHVGDSLTMDIKGANLAGCRSVLFYPQQKEPFPTDATGAVHQPDATIQSLNELLNVLQIT